MGLILGRSSTALQGIQVIPGVVDADYSGEIYVMIGSPTKTVVIHPGQRIAQLIIMPYFSMGSSVSQTPRGKNAFGSSSAAFWVQEIQAQRPTKVLEIQGRKFLGLMDTGADVSCIAGKDWPSSWPTQATPSHLVGLGHASNVAKSSQVLPWSDGEQQGTFTPYVVPSLPISLWGRDVMAQMGLLLVSPNELVTSQMLQMGFHPDKGLGKSLQGRRSPAPIRPKHDKAGLGYQDFLSGPLSK